MTVQRLKHMAAIAAGMPLLIAGLQGCGGGGGDGDKTLVIRFDYSGAVANVLQPSTLDITATGLEGHAPVCRILSGTLPRGLAMEPGSCRISGTPIEATSTAPTVRLTVPGFKGEVDNTVRIVARGPTADYAMDELHLGVGYALTPYDVESSTSLWRPLPGQTLNYAVTAGTLPHGLTLDAATGKIVGVPDQPGYYQFTIQATATSGANTVTSPARSYSRDITRPRIEVNYADLPDKKVGDSILVKPSLFFPADAPADKVTLQFRLHDGDTLPPGLTLDPTTGVVSGVLTGPVPGQNPGMATPWPYDIRIAVNVTLNGYSYVLGPEPYFLVSVWP